MKLRNPALAVAVLLFAACAGRGKDDTVLLRSLIENGEYGKAEREIGRLELSRSAPLIEDDLRAWKAFLRVRQGFLAAAAGFYESDETPREPLHDGIFMLETGRCHEALIIAGRLLDAVESDMEHPFGAYDEADMLNLIQLYMDACLAVDDRENAARILAEIENLYSGDMKRPDFLFDFYRLRTRPAGDEPLYDSYSALLSRCDPDPFWYGRIALYTAEIGYAEGRFTETARLIDELLAAADENRQFSVQARALYLRGGIRQEEGRWENALADFEGSGRLYDLLSRPSDSIMTVYQQGICCYHLARYAQARSLFAEAAAVIDPSDYPAAAADLGIFMGSVDKMFGEYRQAETRFLQSLSLYRGLDDDEGIDASLNNLGVICYLQTDYPRALEYFHEVEGRAAEGRDILLNNIGNVYRKSGAWDAAAAAYREGIAFSLSGSEIHVNLLVNLTRCDYQAGSLDEALEKLAAAEQAAAAGEYRRTEAEIKYFAGRIFLEREEYGRALEALTAAHTLFGESGDMKNLAKCDYSLGIVLTNLKENEKALICFMEAADIYDSIGLSISGEEARAQYRLEYDYVLEALIKGLVEAGDDGKAFYYLEKTKARNMLDSLARNSFEVSTLIPDDIGKERAGLIQLLNNLSREIIEGYGPQPELEAEVGVIEGRLRELQREIELRLPEAVAIEGGRVFDSERIREALDADDILLEYGIVGSDLFLFALTGEGVASRCLTRTDDPVGRLLGSENEVSGIEDLALLYRELLSSPFGSEERIRAIGKALFEALLGEIWETAVRKKNWIIVPERDLFYLPFAALVAPDGRYLVQHDAAVSYSHSAAYYVRRKEKEYPGYGKEYLLFALPDDFLFENWHDDVYAMTASYGSPEYYSNADARESRLESMDLLAYRTIQFLQHGFTFDTFDHMRSSGLVFCEEDADGYDGLLILDEIFNLNMAPELLILTACSSGLGIELPGEGLYGMNQAFFYAGARAILSTLWNVYINETNRFSIILNRLRGVEKLGPKAAVTAAQKELFEVAPHPVYWAPFVLFGYGG